MLESRKISILLASDFPILSESLVSIFKKTEDLQLVGCADTAERLLALAEEFRPEVVLLDVSITSDTFLNLLTRVSEENIKVLVINQDLNAAETIDALRHGAHGVIGKRTTPDLLCKSVRTVIAGDIWVGRHVTQELVRFLRHRPKPSEIARSAAETSNAVAQSTDEPKFGLTKREMQIVKALVEGQTNKDIASTFGISEYTVKHHLTNVFDKLGVYNRVELVLFAINHQLCPSALDRVPPAPAAVGGNERLR